jgi:YD repeat-containing protein
MPESFDSLELLQKIDELADRFEAAHRQGQKPRIEDFLCQIADQHKHALLWQLLRLELSLRRRQGEEPQLAEYLERFPQYAETIERFFRQLTLPVDQAPRIEGGDVHFSVPEPQGDVGKNGAGGDPEGTKSRETKAEEPAATLNLGLLTGPAQFPEVRQGLLAKGLVIEGLLGDGGMGVVYKAKDLNLKSTVALKMIKDPKKASPDLLARFLKEAQAAAWLNDDHIVRVYQYGEVEGFPFIVLEYVEGPNLAKYWVNKPQPAREAAKMAKIAAEAVQRAHDKRLIHRDLKPHNVLLAGMKGQAAGTPNDKEVTWQGEPIPKVSDFGLVKYLDEQDGLTQYGAILGTPEYMAPEQAYGGRLQPVAEAADVYGLGGIIYYGLTGLAPFRGANLADTLHMVRFQEPVPPRQLQPKVPEDLETICLACLEKEPAKRYGSAKELAEELGRFLRGEPILRRPVSRVEKVRRWCKRNPKEALWIGVAAFLLFVCAVGGPILATWALRGEHMAIVKAKEADEAAHREREQKGLKERQRYAGEISLAHSEWRHGLIPQVLQRLQELRPEPGSPDLRAFEWHYLQGLCHLELASFGDQQEIIDLVAFSPDGRSLVSAGAGPTIRVWNLATNRLAFELRGDQPRISGLAFSPNGKHLATAAWDGTIKLWDLSTVRKELRWKAHALRINCLSYNPDGQKLASASHDGNVRIWEAVTGNALQTLRGPAAAVWCCRFSPDGRRLACGYSDGTVKIWDSRTWLEERTLQAHSQRVKSLAFSPDGRLLATGADDRSVRVWDGLNGQLLFALEGHTGAVTDVAFSPDGKRLASSSEDGTARVWDIASRMEQLILGHQSYVYAIAWSPEGRRLATATFSSPGRDETQPMLACVKVWDAVSSHETVRLRGHTDEVRALSFSPDGQWLASASKDRTIRVWNPQTDETIQTLHGNQGGIEALACDGHGRLLAAASTDGTVTIWNLEQGKCSALLRGHSGPVSAVALSADGKFAVSGSEDGTVKLWEVSSSSAIKSLNANTGKVFTLALSRDGRWLAWGGETNVIHIWNVDNSQEVALWEGSNTHVRCLAYSTDSSRLASGGFGKWVEIWDVSSGQKLYSLAGHGDTVEGLAFDSHDERLASSCRDGTVKVWDAVAGREILTMNEEVGQSVDAIYRAVCFHPNGRQLAATGNDWSIRLWDTSEDIEQREIGRDVSSLLTFQFGKGLTMEEIQNKVRQDSTIREEVRHRALSIVEPYGVSLVEYEATRLVRSLFASALMRDEVIAKLGGDTALSVPVRDRALALANNQPENVQALRTASWFVVRQPDSQPGGLKRALCQAEAAHRLAPDNAPVKTALGGAYYRAGRFEAALNILMKADQLCTATGDACHPSTLAFLVMTQFRLGHMQESLQTLRKLRGLMDRPRTINDPTDLALVGEALTLTKLSWQGR